MSSVAKKYSVSHFCAAARLTAGSALENLFSIAFKTATGITSASNFDLQTTSTRGCQTACTINTTGFFAGPTAERAGLTYSIVDTKTVIGAAAFKRQP